MVDDLHDLGTLDTVDRLRELRMVYKNNVLAAHVEHVGRAHDTGVATVLVEHGEHAVLGARHNALGILHGGVNGEEVNLFLGEHLCAYGNGHRNKTSGGKGVVRGGYDGATALFGQVANHARYVGPAAHEQATRTRLKRKALRLVAIGNQDHVAWRNEPVHHFGRRANGELAHANGVVGIAHNHGAVERVEHVLEGRACAGEGKVVQDVHVGVGNILNRDETLKIALAVNHDERTRGGVAHEVPCNMQARLEADAL